MTRIELIAKIATRLLGQGSTTLEQRQRAVTDARSLMEIIEDSSPKQPDTDWYA